MANRLRFHALVVDDLIAATSWYDKISVELGNRFRAAVDERLDSIALNPKSYGLARGTIRAGMVRGFPYVILFESDATTITVLSIVHATSDPKKWDQRN
ncbi:MAG: type II toxin-antitoxin system RelE/ParE family toxin [Planctomycetaceae bacterium]